MAHQITIPVVDPQGHINLSDQIVITFPGAEIDTRLLMLVKSFIDKVAMPYFADIEDAAPPADGADGAAREG